MFWYDVVSSDDEIVVEGIEFYDEAEEIARELSQKHKRTFWIIDKDIDCDVEMIEYTPTEEEKKAMKKLVNEEEEIYREIESLKERLKEIEKAKTELFQLDPFTKI